MKPPSAYMTRFAKYLINSCLILITISAQAQDLFDLQHSREFGLYLMQTQQYALASQEWERVLFLSPGDTLAQLNLIKSFRLSGRPALASYRLHQWSPSGILPRNFSMEGLQSALLQQDFNSFGALLARSGALTAGEKSNFELGAWLLEGQWLSVPPKKRSCVPALGANNHALLDVYNKSLLIRRKSPGTAATLSAIIPGMGKIYSGNWKDGLMSLLFIGVNAWQSYRGFSNDGIKSVRGWAFGVIASGFYTANLLGSWKSAILYNEKKQEQIRHETEGVLFIY